MVRPVPLYALMPAAWLLLPVSPEVVGASPSPTSTTVSMTPSVSRPVIDGRLDETLWRNARPVTQFLQHEPNQGAPVSERTEAVVAFDNQSLYVGARLFDSAPGLIGATLARRDDHIANDKFWVYLDPYRDRQSGFYFGVSAAGTQYDGTLNNDDERDGSWDAVWESSVLRDARGWTVEMRIPLSQLRFDGASKRPWGINLERRIDRKKESALLAYTPRASSGFVSRFPELTGVEALVPPPRIEIAPYVSASVRHQQREAGDPLAHARTPVRGGVDVKAGIGGHLTLNGTIYPDFGQVEVDPAVINLSDVETFYPEKRSFFIEGSSTFSDFGAGGSDSYWNFDWPQPFTFYSRRIGRSPLGSVPADADYADVPEAVDIIGAGKLTGKVGNTNLGALAAVTTAETAQVSVGGVTRAASVDTRTYYGVARAKRTFADGRHAIGGLATLVARDLSQPALADELSKTAAQAGIDGWTTLDEKKVWVINAWGSYSHVAGSKESILKAQQSSVRYFQRPLAGHLEVDPGRTSLSGYAARLRINKKRGNVVANAAAGLASPGYEINDLGFLGVVDRVNAHALTGYRWTEPGKVLRSALLSTALISSWDFSGTMTTRALRAKQDIQLLNYWQAWLMVMAAGEATSTRKTRGGPAMRSPRGLAAETGFRSDLGRPVYGGMHLFVDRYSEQASDSWRVEGYLGSRFAERFAVDFEPAIGRLRTVAQYLETIDDPAASSTFGRRYLFGDLEQKTFSANLRASVIFTPRLSFQLFLQPLVSSFHYRAVNQLAAPNTFTFSPTASDPAAYSKTILSLRGSAVLRWEYLPGSTVYLVWNGSQSRDDVDSGFALSRRLGSLGDLPPNHVVMAKLTYWWTP